MYAQIAAVFALCTAQGLAMPSANPPPHVGDIENGMRLIEINTDGDNVFTMYEHENPDDETPALAARQAICDGSSLTCNGEAGGSHLAPKDTCQLVIDSLDGYPVPNSPRSYCLNQNNGRCCLSWGKVPPSGTAFHAFKSTAMKLQDTCGNNADGRVSGKESSASINGGCIPVCLSSRPDGC